jgi:DNA-binding transcriptional ArsR family regulator
MTVVDLFHALGESTRLKIVERLAQHDTQTITILSHGLPLSRQGVRKHIQILADANVIKLIQQGRTTLVQLDQQTLDKGKQFIAELEQRWEKRLENLKNFVEKKK